MEEAPFNTDTTQFLYKGRLAYTIAAAQLNVLSFSFAVELPENLVDLFPFAADTRHPWVQFELEVNVVSLALTRTQVHEFAFAHFDDLFGWLSHLDFEIFEDVYLAFKQLDIYFFNTFLVVTRIYDSFDEFLRKLEFSVFYFCVVLNGSS